MPRRRRPPKTPCQRHWLLRGGADRARRDDRLEFRSVAGWSPAPRARPYESGPSTASRLHRASISRSWMRWSMVFTMNSGFPSVRSWISAARPAGKLFLGNLTARCCPTASSVRYSRGSSSHCRPRNELLLHRLERMPVCDQLRRPIGADHHEVSGALATSHVCDQVQRREVGSSEGLPARGRAPSALSGRPAHRPFHGASARALFPRPRGRRARDPPGSRATASASATSARVRGARPRHGYPRGTTAELHPRPADTPRSCRTAAGIARCKSLPSGRGDAPSEAFEQRGLTDAGLARHEHHLALGSTRAR